MKGRHPIICQILPTTSWKWRNLAMGKLVGKGEGGRKHVSPAPPAKSANANKMLPQLPKRNSYTKFVFIFNEKDLHKSHDVKVGWWMWVKWSVAYMNWIFVSLGSHPVFKRLCWPVTQSSRENVVQRHVNTVADPQFPTGATPESIDYLAKFLPKTIKMETNVDKEGARGTPLRQIRHCNTLTTGKAYYLT